MRLLSPRERPIEPAPVDLHSYFSDAEIERGARLRAAAARARRWPAAAIELGALALRRAPAAPVAARRGSDRPVLGGAVDRGRRSPSACRCRRCRCAAISRRRGMAVGLVTQSWRGWAADLLKGAAIESVLAAAAGGGGGGRRRGAIRAGGGCRRRPDRSLFGAGCWRRSRRSCSTRCSTTSRRCRRARRAPTCSSSRGAAGVQGGGGLLGRRQPPHHRGQRLRGRAGPDQAGRPVRHAARPLQPRRDPRRRRARARPRAQPRRAARRRCTRRSSRRPRRWRCSG